MSTQTVQNIVFRAAQDREFRALLLSNPAQALAGVDLTEAEAGQLRRLTSESLDSLAIDLKERLKSDPPGVVSKPPGGEK